MLAFLTSALENKNTLTQVGLYFARFIEGSDHF